MFYAVYNGLILLFSNLIKCKRTVEVVLCKPRHEKHRQRRKNKEWADRKRDSSRVNDVLTSVLVYP